MSKAKEATPKAAPKATGKKKSAIDPNETKAERFKRLAVKRTRKVINIVNNIGNCSNRNVYEYTDEQAKHIFAEIQKAVDAAKEKFAKVEAKQKGEAFNL